MTLPTTLLVDDYGRLQVIYLGPVTVETVRADHQRWVVESTLAARRGPGRGRWYFRTPRSLDALAQELLSRGRQQDASYYLTIERRRSRVVERPEIPR